MIENMIAKVQKGRQVTYQDVDALVLVEQKKTGADGKVKFQLKVRGQIRTPTSLSLASIDNQILSWGEFILDPHEREEVTSLSSCRLRETFGIFVEPNAPDDPMTNRVQSVSLLTERQVQAALAG